MQYSKEERRVIPCDWRVIPCNIRSGPPNFAFCVRVQANNKIARGEGNDVFKYTSRTRRTSSPRLPLRVNPIVLCVRDMIDKIVKHPRRHLPACEGELDPLSSALLFLPCLLLAYLFVTKSERPGAAQAASNTHDHLCRRPRVWSLALAGFLSSFPPFPSLLEVPCLCDRGSGLMVWAGCLCAACRRTTRRTTVFDGRVRRSASFLKVPCFRAFPSSFLSSSVFLVTVFPVVIFLGQLPSDDKSAPALLKR